MCRKWSITLVTIVVLALSKRLELDPATQYTIVAFAGAYLGVQGGADAINTIAQKAAQKSTPPAT